jgi:hypothetical protein
MIDTAKIANKAVEPEKRGQMRQREDTTETGKVIESNSSTSTDSAKPIDTKNAENSNEQPELTTSNRIKETYNSFGTS